jgi:Uri superfamily endonuclease
MDDLPAQPGSYALILELTQPQVLEIGRLGGFGFPAGIYVYLGSARGPGGIRARVGRHLRSGDKLHWHFDYLRQTTEIRGFGYLLETGTTMECAWSQKLAASPDARIPVPGFGASDCQAGCPAHLIYFHNLEVEEVLAAVKSLHPGIKIFA